LQSVTSITWYDTADTATVISSSDYYVDTAAEPGRIVLKYGKYWPTDMLRPNRGVVVRFVAGWASRSVVPDQVKSYVRLFTAHRYAHREAVNIGNFGTVESKELAVGLKRIAMHYRTWHF
jgi:uncharacterized phiE125 gp8 family phage protein